MESRFKLKNTITLANERYVQLLQDAESQLVTNVPAGTDEASTVRLVGGTDHGTKFETGTTSARQKRV